MIEIKYNKSNGGTDNFFDLYGVYEYIPMPLTEIRKDGSILKFYISLFKKFGIIDKDTVGIYFWWDIRFNCKFKGIEFQLVYDTDYDMVSFCMGETYISKREALAEELKLLIETEGMNVTIDRSIDIYDANKEFFGF